MDSAADVSDVVMLSFGRSELISLLPVNSDVDVILSHSAVGRSDEMVFDDVMTLLVLSCLCVLAALLIVDDVTVADVVT